MNGNLILSYTGNINGSIVGAFFGGRHSTTGWGSQAYFDDFYVDELSGETPSAPSGRRFHYQAANGAGVNAQFTPSAGSNYQNVDETPPDGDTTYNKALVAGKKDTFTVATFTLAADHVIRAVIPTAVVRKTDAGLDTKLILHAYDGATYQESAQKSVATAYGEIWDRMLLQNDSTAWNETDFNSYQFGYESAGSF